MKSGKVAEALSLLTFAALTGIAATGQNRPDFSGRWSWAAVERNGHRYTLAEANRETDYIDLSEQALKIRMFVVEGGYRTLDLKFVIGQKEAPVGTKKKGNVESAVIGSAHWEGNKLVYEQSSKDEKDGTTFHIIRSMELRNKGAEIVATHHVWTTPSGMKDDATEFWEKKPNAP